jgi:hypothetical protein
VSVTRKTIVPMTAAPMIAQASTSQRPSAGPCRSSAALHPAAQWSFRRHPVGDSAPGNVHHLLKCAERSEPAAEEPPSDKYQHQHCGCQYQAQGVHVGHPPRHRPPGGNTVQALSSPPSGHHASADCPPDVTWPVACQPTTVITTAWIACRVPRAYAPQAAAWGGTRTRTSVALGLRSVRSPCIVIDVSSWSAGRQASPELCITGSGWSASQEDRWIADGEVWRRRPGALGAVRCSSSMWGALAGRS